MKRAFLFVTMLSLAALARADDQTQSVQQALKDQGFYYGEVDGQPGPETDAAIRRYQIRQGLDVTGKLDKETLDSLHSGSPAAAGNTVEAVPPPASDSSDSQPASQDTPAPKSVAQSDREFLQRHPPSTPAPSADDDQAPQPPPPAAVPVEPAVPADAAQTLPADYSRFFRHTPYETAPPVVQRSTVQRAQQRLAREGFYRGVADGELGDSLGRALVAYQRDGDIPPSGRLDMETLADLNLLPRQHAVIRPPVPYDDPYGPPDARTVYRGIWVH